MIKATEEMIDALKRVLQPTPFESTLGPAVQAVLNLVDPVPDEVRVITDRDGDEYYRLTEGGNVWQGECGCCHDTYQQLNAEYGPITWEGRDA